MPHRLIVDPQDQAESQNKRRAIGRPLLAVLSKARSAVATTASAVSVQTAGRPDRRELLERNQAGLTAEQAGLTAEQANLTAQNPYERQAGLTAKSASLPIGTSLPAKSASLPIGARCRRTAESGLGGGHS